MNSFAGLLASVYCKIKSSSRTYSEPSLLVPKLLPTTPVNEHVWPSPFVHVAVAVAPTSRQVMERLLSLGDRASIANGRTAIRA